MRRPHLLLRVVADVLDLGAEAVAAVSLLAVSLVESRPAGTGAATTTTIEQPRPQPAPPRAVAG
ncbi:hypothetical protein [Actinomycetospora lemnae]|uniref:Uncharacterized protein n=1 Tax=Actinomycetospora lemnae TaxID=3019891 RepID=A0ABT5SRH2_9PSEU|nr:hypothetical protein [Actinomycetospora sp. DW7H6]MDD7965457.1 hypothetical protein [Actinomycetospora sp. DW7H6]